MYASGAYSASQTDVVGCEDTSSQWNYTLAPYSRSISLTHSTCNPQTRGVGGHCITLKRPLVTQSHTVMHRHLCCCFGHGSISICLVISESFIFFHLKNWRTLSRTAHASFWPAGCTRQPDVPVGCFLVSVLTPDQHQAVH